MRYRFLLFVPAISLAVTSVSPVQLPMTGTLFGSGVAHADTAPAPGGGPPGGGSPGGGSPGGGSPSPGGSSSAPQQQTQQSSGSKWKSRLGKALADGAVCTIGGYLIEKVSDVKSTLIQRLGNTIICNGVAMLIPVPGLAGFFGLVSTQTICCGSQSIVVKTFRPGGWQCQAQDVGKVAGCGEWLKNHSPKKLFSKKKKKRRGKRH